MLEMIDLVYDFNAIIYIYILALKSCIKLQKYMDIPSFASNL